MRATPLIITAENDRLTFVDELPAEHSKIILPDEFGRTMLSIEDPFDEDEDYANDCDLRTIAHRAVMTNDHAMMRSVCYQVLRNYGRFGA